jgi:hypothetical protein
MTPLGTAGRLRQLSTISSESVACDTKELEDVIPGEILEGGAEALLTKPIDFVALRSEIDSRVAGGRRPRYVNVQAQKSGRPIGKSALPFKNGLHQVSLSGPKSAYN